MRKIFTVPIASCVLFLSVFAVSTSLPINNILAWANSSTSQISEESGLLNQAQQYLEVSQNLKAFEIYKQALKLYQKLGDTKGQALAYIGMGNAYYSHEQLFPLATTRVNVFGDFSLMEGEKSFREALYLAKKIKNTQLEAQALAGIGRAIDRLSMYDRAISYYEQALSITRQIGDRKLEGRLLNYIGESRIERSDLLNTANYHQQAVTIAQESGDQQGEALALQSLCRLYRYRSDYEVVNKTNKAGAMQKQAKQYCQKALAIFKQVNDSSRSINVLRSLASEYKDLVNPQESIGYYQQILAIAKSNNDRQEVKSTLTILGNSYEELNEYQQAIDYYLQALNLFQPAEINDLDAYYVYKYLGRSYVYLNQYQIAISYYQKALTIAQDYRKQNNEEYFFYEREILSDLADAYYGQNDFHKAVEFYGNSLALYKDSSDEEMRGYLLCSLGVSQYGLGNYQLAIANYLASLKIYQSLTMPKEQAVLLANLGEAWFAYGEYQKSIDAYQKALLIYQQLDDRDAAIQLTSEIKKVTDTLVNKKS
ncbi:tetratricopeptide repeat protein [Pseudanabaena mucicola]|uniref:Tetratricopeptide repeat protein n=1 Tax=Pseudanabaena mucicola FACHB-723 TaxID=2692860 RepID=A0ABR7ZRL0_9CYAN|nr:tetratricopeptide repeat protein [Pseudanabaena mucicola]MBD2186566.1 tetratricopeptide repeat protein [Pseudanabaena mucicola FACHB-723]